MTIKEIVKPTIWRIILTIIIFFIVFYTRIPKFCPAILLSEEVCAINDRHLYSPNFACPKCMTNTEIKNSKVIFASLAIIMILASYIISTIIALLFKKIFRK